MTEHNPAPSPSGHPLLSGPPTLTDIQQIFTVHYSLPPPHHDSASADKTRQGRVSPWTLGPARLISVTGHSHQLAPETLSPRARTAHTARTHTARTSSARRRPAGWRRRAIAWKQSEQPQPLHRPSTTAVLSHLASPCRTAPYALRRSAPCTRLTTPHAHHHTWKESPQPTRDGHHTTHTKLSVV